MLPEDKLTVTDDDVLVYIFFFLSPPEILSMRMTCKRMYALSNLRAVWMNACFAHVLNEGYPFPSLSLDSMSISELERRTCHAFRLASRWLSDLSTAPQVVHIDATSSISVSDVRFVPGHDGQWILTVSKGIWSVITVWDISADPRKCCEWSQRGAIYSGFSINTDSSSAAAVAVSVLNDGEHTVDILSIDVGIDGTAAFRRLLSIRSSFKPVKMQGDLLAIGDDIATTVIWDWKAGTSAILRHHIEEDDIFQQDKCIQVVFAHKSVLVVRARSIHLFPEPILHVDPRLNQPIVRYSFGWIDGVSVTASRRSNTLLPYEPLSILIRGESDDPWSAGMHTLDLYILQPNPDFEAVEPKTEDADPPRTYLSPYIFPPTLVTQVASSRGSLRCRDISLGRSGTAVWIQPRDRAIVGLVSTDHDNPLQTAISANRNESLVAAVFPGALAPRPAAHSGIYHGFFVRSRTILTNSQNNWTSLDYDEELGRIALGSSFEQVVIIKI